MDSWPIDHFRLKTEVTIKAADRSRLIAVLRPQSLHSLQGSNTSPSSGLTDDAMTLLAAGGLAKDKDVSEEEIELWIEHVDPVWRKDSAWMKTALANWYGAMQTAGLAPEGENKMERFIRYGI